MTKQKIQKMIAVLCIAAAAVCLVLGLLNVPKQNGAAGQEILQQLRIQTLLSATGDSVVESYVAIAKQEAQKQAKEAGGGMAAIREAVEKAEAETRAKYEGGAAVPGEGDKLVPVDADSYVSMNMWGLTPEFLDVVETGFAEFLKNVKPGDIKAEYLLPGIIDELLKSGKATVRVLETKDKWFGVTYKEDKQSVVDSFKKLIADGVYNEKLFS